MNFESLQTPALLIRLDRVRANLERMRVLLAPHGGFARWRPHVKTAKVPEVQRMLLEVGLRTFKCATTREAAVLLELASENELDIDVLVAMSHRGANLKRVAELARNSPRQRVSILTEDAEHARDVRALDANLGLFVDLDPNFGRSGIPFEQTDRIRATLQNCGPALRGLHAYEGQVRASDPAERARICEPLFEQLAATVRAFDLTRHETITSGTPTFLEALHSPALRGLHHTISPGIVVYWDTNSAALHIEGFQCAATVLSRVISAPHTGRITLDAGSKSIDAAAGDPCVQLVGFDARANKPSEEHLPVDCLGAAPALGQLIELLPRHVCPMINLADHAVLLEHDQILALAPITARGHES